MQLSTSPLPLPNFSHVGRVTVRRGETGFSAVARYRRETGNVACVVVRRMRPKAA